MVTLFFILGLTILESRMTKITAKNMLLELLEPTEIKVNGNNPWDIQIKNDEFFPRVFKEGVLGLGESYMDGWWECRRLDQLFEKLIQANLEEQVKTNKKFLLKSLLLKFINLQTKERSWHVGEKHYDLGNELFKNMLDSRMNYTCGYWEKVTTLEEAQRDKLELVCRKLQLQPGMKLLDIGCGFGALAKYAAENYDVNVVGVTISKEQAALARQRCQGLPVDIVLTDYRDITGKFDRIASLGMFEHVGKLNYRTYMEVVHDSLTDDGLFLLHTIGDNVTTASANEWTTKYIFPNGVLPSISGIGKGCEGLLIMEDWHNFGVDYDKTLLAWYDNFNQNWDKLKHLSDERFYRMWNYYLLSSAGSFRARYIQLWQIVFSKSGLKKGYHRPSL